VGPGWSLLWWSFAMTAVLFGLLVVLLSQAIVDPDQTLLAPATTVGGLAAIVQFLGWIGWPFLVSYLARAAPAPDATPARLEASTSSSSPWTGTSASPSASTSATPGSKVAMGNASREIRRRD
jgi:hypothetical protein